MVFLPWPPLTRLQGWPDVRVQAEEVGRVVRVFQGHQPFVVRAIGGPDAVVTIVEAQFIDVHTYASEPMHRLPELAGPVDVLVRFCWVLPLRHNKELMRMCTVGKGGLLLAHPAGHAVDREQRYRRH